MRGKKMSLDQKLSDNKAHLTGLKRFFNKIKYVAIIPLAAAAIACSDYKKIYDGNHTEIYANADASKVKIETGRALGRSETYFFIGPSLDSLFELDAEHLHLIKYKNKPWGPFNNSTYDEKDNVVDKAFMSIKEEQGRKILKRNACSMERYLHR